MFNAKLYAYSLALILLTLPLASPAQLTFGPGPEQPNTALDAIVAVVNNDIITRRELEQATAQIQRQIQQKKVPLPPRDLLESQVLERLILTHLQLRAAEQQGISIDDATLNAAIESVAQRNNMSLSQLQQTIEKDGATFAQFRDDVRHELLAARLRQKVVDSQIHISEQDVASLQAQVAKEQVAKEQRPDHSGQAQYHIAQILLATPEGATPQQIAEVKRKAEQVLSQLRKGEDFQQVAAGMSAGQHALEGGDLGWRTAEQLPTIFANVVPKMQVGAFSQLIRSPSGFHIVKLIEMRGGAAQAKPAKTKNAEPSTEQQTRARHILLKTSPTRSDEQVRQQLEQLRQQLAQGADFAELARAHSEDKVSGAKGGDLGWTRPGMMVPEFEKTLDSLQINEISAPFKTRFGWHIVQAQERRQGGTESERVKEALFRRRSDEEWQQWQRRLRNEAYVEIRLPPPAGAQP